MEKTHFFWGQGWVYGLYPINPVKTFFYSF